jgi:hypothetical protein
MKTLVAAEALKLGRMLTAVNVSPQRAALEAVRKIPPL